MKSAKSAFFPVALIVVFGLAFAAGVRSLNSKDPSALEFATTTQAAFSKAKSEGKLVMIDFNADWCGPCQLMKKEAFSDPGFAKVMANVVPVSINVDRPGEDAKWVERERELALPTLVFLDADGNEVGRTVGYGGLEPLKEEVQKIVSRV